MAATPAASVMLLLVVGDVESVDDDDVDIVRCGRERFTMLTTDSAGDEGGGEDVGELFLTSRRLVEVDALAC